MLRDLGHDLRNAARMLRKRPGFAAAAVLTLALGIGSNAAIFAVIYAVLRRPLPFPHSERLLAVYTRYLPSTGQDFPYFALSQPEFADVRRRVDAFGGNRRVQLRQPQLDARRWQPSSASSRCA